MPRPFTFRVPTAILRTLRERLARTRFPDSAPGERWLYGTDVDYLRSLVDYWRGPFDWRAQEARLNAFPQFKISRPDYDLHFLHVPGKGPNPTPLLLMHGWPGSVFEFLDFIPAPHRSRELRRRSGGRLHGRCAVAARLRPLVPAGAEALRRRGVRGLFRRTHDRHPWLQALRRAGRRLGRHHRRGSATRTPTE